MSLATLNARLASGPPSVSPFFVLGDPTPDLSLELCERAIAAGAGLLFDDRSEADDRFQRDRTGFHAETRLRIREDRAGNPQLFLRGGYEGRGGTRQLRFHRDPSGAWLGLGDRLGSLEAGKDANIVFLNGDPFETGTKIEAVVLEGPEHAVEVSAVDRVLGTPGADRVDELVAVIGPVPQGQQHGRFEEPLDAGRDNPLACLRVPEAAPVAALVAVAVAHQLSTGSSTRAR